MKRTALVCAAVLMAMMCAAQTSPHGAGGGSHPGMDSDPSAGVRSNRSAFGEGCGIQDTSTDSSLEFRRSDAGEWSAAGAESGPGTLGSAVARVWHESNWMVDMHSALGPGMTTMHTGQMCFDQQGHVTYLVDNFVELAQCGCTRFTSLAFGSDGRVMRREQRFIRVETGSEIEAPEMAKSFPEVWDFRRLDLLPFYSLMKK